MDTTYVEVRFERGSSASSMAQYHVVAERFGISLFGDAILVEGRLDDDVVTVAGDLLPTRWDAEIQCG